MEAERQECGSVSVGEESEVADAHEARRQQVEQEAAQELFDTKGHASLLVAVRGISPAKCNITFGERNEPGVGDGNTMGIGAEIAQDVFRSTKRPLGIDNPIVPEQ